MHSPLRQSLRRSCLHLLSPVLSARPHTLARSFRSLASPSAPKMDHSAFAHSATELSKELLTFRDLLRYATSQFTKYELQYGQCTTNAYEDALFLLMETLHLPIDHPADVSTWFGCAITLRERELFLGHVSTRITTRRPAAYMMGKAYYHGDAYLVNENVIIPRSYIGEMLLNTDYVNKGNEYLINASGVKSILDLCTGSGVLAIHACKVFDSVETVHASDISMDSLEVANRNIEMKRLGKLISTFQGDLFSFPGACTYDLIICNPPYVDEESMRSLPPEYRYEPVRTLAAGPDGFSILDRVIRESAAHLNERGVLLCEVGLRRPELEKHFPRLARKLFWLNSEESEGEVFVARRADLIATTTES